MKRLLAACTAAILAGHAFGQSFNIDLNNATGSGAGEPSVSYGAAANQPGFWNGVTGATASISGLAGLDGAGTNVVFTRDTAGTFTGTADAGATGDAAKLLLDYDSLAAGTLDYTVSNLQGGWYVVYTYAVRPNADTSQAGVDVLGSSSEYQYVGGNLSGSGIVPGVTHSIHIYPVLDNGSIQIKVSDASGPAVCNAIQIRKISVDDRLRFYVDKDATRPQDGNSWASAFRDLQTALVTAQHIHGIWAEVWVAQGFYYPTTGTDRNASFVIDEGLQIYGGFQGTETSLAERTTPWAFITAMSGAIGTGAATDNSYHVVRLHLGHNGTIIDGFTIANGYANGSGVDAHGAGLLLSNSSARFQNCKFLSNTSALDGGAVYVHGSNPKFLNCLWYNNKSSNGAGGAVHMHTSGQLWIYNGDFRKNYSAGAGGAVSVSACPASMANCFFDGNTASFGHGGAVYIAGDNEDDAIIANSTFSLNHSGMVGGGLYVNNASDVTLDNCILWGNTDATGASASGQQRGANGNTDATITSHFTTVEGIDPNPKFVDADGPDNVAGNFDDDCHLQGDSACIDNGSNYVLPTDVNDADSDGDIAERLPFDLDGNTRRTNSPSVFDFGAGTAPIVDRGCYEFQPCGPDFDGDGFVTGVDFDLFVHEFEAGSPLSDWDQDGFVTGIDFDLFTEAFEEGC